MIKKFILFIFLILCLTAGSLYFLLNSSWAYETAFPFVLRSFIPEIAFSALTVEKQVFRFPGRLTLRNVRASFIKEKEKFDVTIKEINARASLWPENISLDLKGGLLSSSHIRTDNIFIHLQSQGKIQNLKGNMKISSVAFDDYLLTDMSGALSIEDKKISLGDIRARFFGGALRGEILLDVQENFPYSIQIDAKNIDLGKLRGVNDPVFSTVKGFVDGHAELKGDVERIDSMTAEFTAPHGGFLKASVLAYLMDYIPQTAQRKDLEILIKEDGDVLLEKADVSLESISDETLKTSVKITSKKFNLDADVDIDINIEGGLKSFLSSFATVSQ